MGKEEAKRQVEYLFHQSPRQYSVARTRWRLQDVGKALKWLEGCSQPGVYQVLKRLGFSRKRAMNFIDSPDPAYHRKWKAVLQAFMEAMNHPEEVVIVFLDEFSYYRQPTLACAYHATGNTLPYAFQGARSNTRTRLIAVLDGLTGKVTYLQRSTIGVLALQEFYQQVRTEYPQAKRIYIVQDNWPVHKLPAVLRAMQDHGLTPLFLPTYASWLNPIEKLWRWLRQDILHLHSLPNDLETLRMQVRNFLDSFTSGSDPLLRYVGLLD
ncbi:MAG: IS630 family transposase [Nitrososphaera sp.]|nr:IS630 family transposase [Nitrososphaera sp.]